VYVDADHQSAEQSAAQILAALEERGLIPAAVPA
jgi:hypothetical protein